ncbi:hypothetical protein JMJ35_009260 [Cladonia borealis]|uniref:Uncharacterized protein n=1 Tax=Cladonia borealis TaxID=184061 RepID=A0AA39QUM9_9LECA|nr:hypothetical protein JMJ35_009260 [Cladonia borealis]
MKSLDLKVTFPERKILNVKKSVRKNLSLYKLLQKFVHQQTRPTHTSWLPPSYNRFRRLCEHLQQHPKMLTEIRSVSLTVQDRTWYTSCVQHNRLLHNFPYLDHLTLSPPPPMSFRLLEQNPDYGPRFLRSLRLDFLPITAPLYHGNVLEDINNVIDHYRYWLGLHKLRIDGLGFINVPFRDEGVTFIRDLWCVGCRQCEAAVMTTQLIRSSTGLVRYIFETDTDRSPYRLFPPQDHFFLYTDLLMHRCTLRQLVIATSNLGVIHESWKLGSLRTFSQLEKLALPCFMVPAPSLGKADYEMLPPNLEELQIEYNFNGNPLVFDNENRLEIFRRWTDQMKSRLPYLRRLIFWYQGDPVQMAERNSGMFDPAILKTLQVLEQAFNEFDIKLVWLSASSFWDTPVGKALDAEGDVIMEESGDAERDSITLHPTSITV